MFGLETLDVAIGVIFVFLLVSLLCSAIREGIETWMKTRAAYLWLGIRELLHDKGATGLAATFYEHPLIYSLFPGDFDKAKTLDKPRFWANGRGVPSYIPSRNFAVALMDIAARGPLTNTMTADGGAPVVSLENIRANIRNIDNPAVQRVLLSAVDSAQGDLNRAQLNLEAWFNSSMDRVSGWYKRTTQWWLFAIGLVIAVGMNIDTVSIADYLYRTPKVREAVVMKADAYLKAASTSTNAGTAKTSEEQYDAAKNELQSLSLPIGWGPDRVKRDPGGLKNEDLWHGRFLPVLGWLITALAATMGAPFWFDLLNKVMVIRSTVKPHEKSQEEGSEDRQPKAAPAVMLTQPQPQPQPGALQQPPPLPPPLPLAEQRAAVVSRDIEWDVDACGGIPAVLTEDEDLPQADGGVE